jgi:hypothetical protein
MSCLGIYFCHLGRTIKLEANCYQFVSDRYGNVINSLCVLPPYSALLKKPESAEERFQWVGVRIVADPELFWGLRHCLLAVSGSRLINQDANEREIHISIQDQLDGSIRGFQLIKMRKEQTWTIERLSDLILARE